MTILYLLLSIIAFWFHFTRKKSKFLFVYIFTITEGFYFLPSSDNIKYIAGFVPAMIVVIESFKNRNYISYSKDKIAGWILAMLIFELLHMFVTVWVGAETMIDSFKVFSKELYLLGYFIYRQYSIKDLEILKKPIFICCLLAAIAYYLQFLGMNILYGRVDESINFNGLRRYMNVPAFTLWILCYLFYGKVDSFNRKIFLVLFIPLIILPMARGQIVAFTIANLIMLCFVIRQKGGIVKGLLLITIVFLVSLPLLESRFLGGNSRVGFVEELHNIRAMNSSEDFDGTTFDTFGFRIALARERFEYMMNHPTTFLYGVGSIYELSPYNHFNFRIGSGLIEKDGLLTIMQIETTDISFVTHFFRYGLLYMCFIISFIVISLKRMYKLTSVSIFFIIGFVILSKDVLQCLSSAPFMDYRVTRMFTLLLLSALAYNTQKRMNQIHME